MSFVVYCFWLYKHLGRFISAQEGLTRLVHTPINIPDNTITNANQIGNQNWQTVAQGLFMTLEKQCVLDRAAKVECQISLGETLLPLWQTNLRLGEKLNWVHYTMENQTR